MRTRSQSRHNSPQQEASPVIVEPLRIELPFLEDQFQEDPPPEVPMADNQTMAELLQAPTEGYKDAIVIPEIAANNFELKHGLISLVQNKQFFGHDKEDPHAHIRYFNKITSTMRVPNTTNLRNKITRFQQRFDESFYEAWDRFNDLLRACPHNGFSKLHQLDTFYNALNVNDQDSLNSAACGNFLDKMPRECLKIIESKSEVRQSRAKEVVAKVGTNSSTPAISSKVVELKDLVRALLLDKKNQSSSSTSSLAPAPVKAVKPNCVTCSGTHSYQNCPTTSRNAYRDNIQDYVKANDAVLRNMQNQGQNVQNELANLTDMLSKFMSSNTASSSGSGILPSNTIANPKKELKGITTRSGVAYQGPINSTPSKGVKQGTEVNKDQVQTPSSPSTATVQPPVYQSEIPTLNSEPVVASVSAPMPNVKSSIPYPSRPDFVVVDFEPDPRVPLILERCFLKTGRALIDVHKGELTLRIGNEAITYNLDQTVGYSANYNEMTANKIDVICEMYSQEVLGFFDTTAIGNPTPHDDPIVSTTSPTLTPFGDNDFLLFEEADAFPGLEVDPDSPKINPFYDDPEGDILLLETILNSEPLPPFPNHKQYMPSYKKELKVCEAKTIKPSVDEPPEVKLKDLPPHLKYAFLEGDNKLPVIITKELGGEEKSALIKVLKSHKRAIAWKLSDIQGINPEFYTHKIIMEEDYKPAVQHQRRVNHKIHNVIKKEVEKLLDAGLIYPISDSPWVSPTMEVFMDDFSVFGNSFENCLSRLDKMLQRCEDTNLSLNWEKSHFMVKEGIILGHKISKKGIEVDRAKVDVIAKLPQPTTVKEYSQEILGFFDVTASGNPTPHDDPIVSTTSPTLTPFGDSDFLLFEEADAFLGLEDDPNSPKINPFYYDPEGDILLLEVILNSEPLPPLPNHEKYLPSFKKELKVAKTEKSSVDEPPEVELKDLPPHLKYAFLEGDNKLPIIIAKELGDEEKSTLIKVLKSQKQAIAWKLSDIQGINPKFYTHKILME
nr:retrovirus-related Pol polyprotein [Tanacetum cinerariifolium]